MYRLGYFAEQEAQQNSAAGTDEGTPFPDFRSLDVSIQDLTSFPFPLLR
jgi:hypothetical protein